LNDKLMHTAMCVFKTAMCFSIPEFNELQLTYGQLPS